MKKNIICGLDIGTFKICATCAKADLSGKIDLLASFIAPAEGMSKGLIIDGKRVSACLRKAMAGLSKIYGKRLKRVYVNINSPDLRVKLCDSAHIPLDRREILINSVSSDSAVVSALIPTINNFIKSVKAAGLILEGIVPSGYAQALCLFKDLKPGTKGMIIDLGAALTKISLFQERMLKKIIILPVGAQSITQEIAAKLKVSLDCAEELKTKYGRLLQKDQPLDQKIIIQDKSIKRIILAKNLYEIITARADYLLQRIKKPLSGVDKEFKQIIVTGGGAILEGFLEKAEKVLEKPVKIGFLHAVNNHRIQAQSALYATSIGLIYFGFQSKDNKNLFMRKKIGPFMHRLNRARSLYREYF